MLSIAYFLFIIPVFLTLFNKFTKKNYFFNYLVFFIILINFYIFFIKYFNIEGITSFLDYSNIFLIVTVLLDYIISFGIYISKFENKKINIKNIDIGIKDFFYYILFFMGCSHSSVILHQSNLLEIFISKELKNCYGKIEYNKILESYSYLLNSPEFWIVQFEVIITLILLMRIVLSITNLVHKNNFEYKPKIGLSIILSIIALTVILFYFIEYFSPIKNKIFILPAFYSDMLSRKKVVYYIYFIIVYLIYTFFATLNEELFCRFILIDTLRIRYSEKLSFVISIVYWVIAHSILSFNMHFDFIYLIYVIFIGILLTLLRIKKNSIILNVSIHYLVNIINVIILFSKL